MARKGDVVGERLLRWRPRFRPLRGGGQIARIASWRADFILLADPRFLLQAAVSTLATGMIALYDTVSPFDLETRLGLSRTTFGNLSLSLTGAYLVGAILVNRLVVRLGQARLLVLGAACALACAAAMLLAALAGGFSVGTVLLPMLPLAIALSLAMVVGVYRRRLLSPAR